MATRRSRLFKRRKSIRKRKQKGGYLVDQTMRESITITLRDEYENYEKMDQFRIDANKYFSKNEEENPLFKADLPGILAGLKDICDRYAKIIALQTEQIVTSGDILYYPPGPVYLSGHIETVLGLIHLSPQNLLYISRTHPNGPIFSEIYMLINNNALTYNRGIKRLRYTGANKELIRATTAFLSKLFLQNNMIDYSLGKIISKIGSKLLSSFSSGSVCVEKKLDEIVRRVEKTKEKLLTHEKVGTVCSGFTILMYELAFLIHDMKDELLTAMPFDAKACTPGAFFSKIGNLSKNPHNWEISAYPDPVEGYENVKPLEGIKMDTIDTLLNIDYVDTRD